MDILIEATKHFEQDLASLSEDEQAVTVECINDFADRFSTQETGADPEFHLLPDLNGYDSSLYKLRVAPTLRVILTVDEDPIFGQVVFTLLRVISRADCDRAYRAVAQSLYEDLLHPDRETAQAS